MSDRTSTDARQDYTIESQEIHHRYTRVQTERQTEIPSRYHRSKRDSARQKRQIAQTRGRAIASGA